MNRGQSLFEVVLAIAVVTLITVGVIILSTSAIKNSSYSRNKTLASKYIQETIEWLRNERENGYSDFIVKMQVPIYCFNNLNWTEPGVCPSDEYMLNTNMKREAEFNNSLVDGKNLTEVEIKVYWNDGSGYHEVKNISNFTDIREK